MHLPEDKEDFTCHDMGTLSGGDVVEVVVEGEKEEKSWLSKVTVERDSSGGQGRISHGNGRSREMFQRIIDKRETGQYQLMWGKGIIHNRNLNYL